MPRSVFPARAMSVRSSELMVHLLLKTKVGTCAWRVTARQSIGARFSQNRNVGFRPWKVVNEAVFWMVFITSLALIMMRTPILNWRYFNGRSWDQNVKFFPKSGSENVHEFQNDLLISALFSY